MSGIRLPVTTARMSLRLPTPDDVPALLAIYGPPETSRYLYTEPFDETLALDVVRKRGQQPAMSSDGDALRVLGVARRTGEVVADFTLILSSAEHRQGEVGYVVHPDHRGEGYAVEGGQSMLRLGFERLGLHRMIARCDARNAGSVGVMRRLGMRQEAHFLQNEWIKGEWTDEIVAAMLDEEWARRS